MHLDDRQKTRLAPIACPQVLFSLLKHPTNCGQLAAKRIRSKKGDTNRGKKKQRTPKRKIKKSGAQPPFTISHHLTNETTIHQSPDTNPQQKKIRKKVDPSKLEVSEKRDES